MKMNGTTLKLIAAGVVIVGVIFWGLTSIGSKSFSGANLAFGADAGTIKVTNPSDAPVDVQMIGTGSRGFSVVSSVEGLAGTSAKQGTGTTTTQLLEFKLPPGTSEFTVVKGTDVQFVSTSPTVLNAVVAPMTSDSVRSTLIFTAAVILAALFFMSYTTNHAWINMIRGRAATPAYVPIAISDTAQGQALRGFGDNRKKD
jgi:hypothetical protein